LIVARFAATRIRARFLPAAGPMTRQWDLAANLKLAQTSLKDAKRLLRKKQNRIDVLEEQQKKTIRRLEKYRRRLEDQKRQGPPRTTSEATAAPDESSYPKFRTFAVHGNMCRMLCRSAKEVRKIKRLVGEEAATFEWLRETLASTDVFFDVGADVGTFAIFAASRLGPSGRVYAFEPHVTGVSGLLANIEVNGLRDRVEMVSTQLSDRDEFAPFRHDSPDRPDMAIELRSRCRLDTLLEQGVLPPPTVVRISAGGGEAQVIGGMEKLLRSPHAPRSIHVAVNAATFGEIMSRMNGLGYDATAPAGAPSRDAAEQTPRNVIFAKG
jgi:FkbM family methyltransferase